MASWCLVLMAVPYEDVLILLRMRTVSVRGTAVQNKPHTNPPDVQVAGDKTGTSGSSSRNGCLPDLLQSVPRLVPSCEGDAASPASDPVTEQVRSHCPRMTLQMSVRRAPLTSETVTRCGDQLRRVADDLHNSRQMHAPDSVWKRIEPHLDLKHLLWTSMAVHVAYTAVRAST